jgi:hypothetical protein
MTSCIAFAGTFVLFSTSFMQIEANAGAGIEASCERKEPIGVRQASRMKTSYLVKMIGINLNKNYYYLYI